jgi:RNA 3'-terminal phosphate cyclase
MHAHSCVSSCVFVCVGCGRGVTHPCMLSGDGIDHACVRVGRRGRCVQGGGHVLAYAQNVKHEAQCQSEEPPADTASRPQHSSNRLSTTSPRQRQSSHPIDKGTPQNKADSNDLVNSSPAGSETSQ